MSFSALKFSTWCVLLNLALLSKDSMIASAADAILGIMNNATSDILALIDSKNSKIGN